jgi:hypothetical protein
LLWVYGAKPSVQTPVGKPDLTVVLLIALADARFYRHHHCAADFRYLPDPVEQLVSRRSAQGLWPKFQTSERQAPLGHDRAMEEALRYWCVTAAWSGSRS